MLTDVYQDIIKLFEKNKDIIFGISNLNLTEYKCEYKCALVFAVPYSEQLNIKDYKEEKLENLIYEARDRINLLLEDITTILKKYSLPYCIPPTGQTSEEPCIAPFSFKYACVNAGLGWIGKNDVLITEKYGPRVRLSAILINYDLPLGIPTIKSKCPSECTICIKACPHNALTGHQWNIEKKRDELIDYKLCNEKRSMYIETHGRKDSCGLCIVSCPIGISSKN